MRLQRRSRRTPDGTRPMKDRSWRIPLKNSETEPRRNSCFCAYSVHWAASTDGKAYGSVARGKTGSSAGPLGNLSLRLPAAFGIVIDLEIRVFQRYRRIPSVAPWAAFRLRAVVRGRGIGSADLRCCVIIDLPSEQGRCGEPVGRGSSGVYVAALSRRKHRSPLGAPQYNSSMPASLSVAQRLRGLRDRGSVLRSSGVATLYLPRR